MLLKFPCIGVEKIFEIISFKFLIILIDILSLPIQHFYFKIYTIFSINNTSSSFNEFNLLFYNLIIQYIIDETQNLTIFFK